MVEQVVRVRAEDRDAIAQLARLQFSILPDSLISRLGVGFVEEFYGFACNSRREIVLCSRAGGEVTGGCVVTLAPHTLSRRLLLRTSLVIRLLRLPPRVLIRSLGGGGPGWVKGMPELILLFTRPDQRSRGIGARLVQEAERELWKGGIGEYAVKTFDDEVHGAVRFYRREGFRDRGTANLHGEVFRYFSKCVSAPAAEGSLSPIGTQDA